jgi:CheY-like chemotaxis protein
MKLIGGSVSVISKPGVGSDFKLVIPNNKTYENKSDIKSEGKDKRNNKEIKDEASPKNRPKILYVEDEKDCFELVSLILKKQYNVEKAFTGEEGILKASEKEYSLILLDINLGEGMTGIDVMKEIRKLDYYKEKPIIAITGFAMKGDEQKFIAAGCTDYISKPFDKSILIEKISQALINDNKCVHQ